MFGYQPETLDQPTHPNTTSSLSHGLYCETDSRTARRADNRAAVLLGLIRELLRPRREREHTPSGGETPWTDTGAPAMPDEKASTPPHALSMWGVLPAHTQTF